MGKSKTTILAVDDEVFNLEILSEHLDDAGYIPVVAENGRLAWELLQESPERFDAVLLDRMMPEMDGMEVLARIKSHAQLSLLPVIMQTAKAGKQDILDGLQAGAYYYLTKPFDKNQLLAIVKTATSDYQSRRALMEEVYQSVRTLSMMDHGRFSFRTLQEGRDLVTLLSNAISKAPHVVMGLSELVINAVEHGNLGIGYEEKSWLNQQGTWEEEVEKRLLMPENSSKMVTLEFNRTETEVSFVIQDQGDGFAWQNYLDISPERAFDSHGRGIAMAKMMSFDHLEYMGNGNRVQAVISLKDAISACHPGAEE